MITLATKPPRKPVNRRKFDDWFKRIKTNTIVVPVLVELQCRCLLYAYHGGALRTLAFMARWEFACWLSRTKTDLAMWLSDRAGWTKIYTVPETETHIAHQQRHGRRCSGSPNCGNFNCINDSLPRWFKWLFGRQEI